MTRPTDEQIKALRKGDVVTVRAVVFDPKPDADGDVELEVVAGGNPNKSLWCLPCAIATIEPREIKVGDRVESVSGKSKGTVKCVEGEQAAILWDDWGFQIQNHKSLQVIS